MAGIERAKEIAGALAALKKERHAEATQHDVLSWRVAFGA